MAIVQASEKTGEIIFKAKSQKIKGNQIKIQVK